MSKRDLRRPLGGMRPRWKRPSERMSLVMFLLCMVVGTAWSIGDDNRQVKVASVMVTVIVLSSLILSSRGMWIISGAIVACLAVVFRVHGVNPSQLSVSGFVMIAIALTVALLQTIRRDRLGLKQVSAEKVIGQIRDRLLVQAQLPELPDGWTVEVEQRPADAAAIAGDFVSSRLVLEGDHAVLHLAVIDVSGSGIVAGPRALLFSGAVGGLLGSVPPEDFLGAANDYLSRQRWSMSFASAIYIRTDLTTGEYQVRVAGHPPAVHFRPLQASPWRTSTATGTLLGVLPSLAGTADRAVVEPDEALFLYTDGMVEDRTGDLDSGTLKFKDRVEQLAAAGLWDGMARKLIQEIPAKRDDDRTVVVIRRAFASSATAGEQRTLSAAEPGAL